MRTHTLLLLLLASLALYKTFVLFREHLSFMVTTYDVRIINGFANNSSLPLVVWCASEDTGEIGGRALQERDDYAWTVTTRSSPFLCTIKWDGMRKSFEAFRLKRDRHRCGDLRRCFWLVKEDGFYFSNDGVHWINDISWTSFDWQWRNNCALFLDGIFGWDWEIPSYESEPLIGRDIKAVVVIGTPHTSSYTKV